MEFDQLRCFVTVAEELHFSRASRRLGMHPAALGRHIRLLEEDLGTQLLLRTTRFVSLTPDGSALLDEARAVLAKVQEVSQKFRDRSRQKARTLRLGAIDTAAAGLVPMLLRDFREEHPDIAVQVVEDKTIRLLPRLLSGSLDLAFVRPPEFLGRELDFRSLFHETAVVAVPAGHRLARRRRVPVSALADEPLIVPDRRSRPHSHNLTLKLFERAGIRPAIAQIADEKQTIIRLVAEGFGIAIVPRWAAKMAVPGVKYLPLDPEDVAGINVLPLAAAWMRGSRDPLREALLTTLEAHLASYSAQA